MSARLSVVWHRLFLLVFRILKKVTQVDDPVFCNGLVELLWGGGVLGRARKSHTCNFLGTPVDVEVFSLPGLQPERLKMKWMSRRAPWSNVGTEDSSGTYSA